jgi:hypothetical protein
MKIHPMFHPSLLEPYHIASTIQEKVLEPFPHLIEINGEQEFKIFIFFHSSMSNHLLYTLFIGKDMM